MPVDFARTDPALPALLSTVGTVAAGGGALLLSPGGAFLSAGFALCGAFAAGAGGAALGRRLRGVHGRESFHLDDQIARVENPAGRVDVALRPGTPFRLHRVDGRDRVLFLAALGDGDASLAFGTTMSPATVRSAPADEAAVLATASVEVCPVGDRRSIRLPLSTWWKAHAIAARAVRT